MELDETIDGTAVDPVPQGMASTWRGPRVGGVEEGRRGGRQRDSKKSILAGEVEVRGRGSGRIRLAVVPDRSAATFARFTAAAARSRSASRSIPFFLKPLTIVSLSRRGLRSGVVSTAATNGVLPAAPRPRLPPGRCPPRSASSTSTRPASLGFSASRAATDGSAVRPVPSGSRRLKRAGRGRHQLVLDQPGRGPPGAQPTGQLTAASRPCSG